MNRYRAAFFDRDGTLLHRDPAEANKRREMIEAWSGRPLAVPNDLFMRVLDEKRLLTVENEIAFWKRYFAELLRAQGVTGRLDERAEELFSGYWLQGMLVYPEVADTLEWFRAHGYRMGVISDTFPSLRLTIEAAGLGAYFDCYICADQVGVMKPDARMYRAALGALKVCAEESLYVDDYDVESGGAREIGMTAFHVCRDAEPKQLWDIASLAEMTEFAERFTAGGSGKPK